jgi:hypothetical protein
MPTAFNDDVDLQIWSRDSSFNRITLIEVWSEFHVDLKWGDMSTWSLSMPTDAFMDAFNITNLANTTLVNFGIKAYRNREYFPLIAGPITDAARTWNGTDDTIVLTGAEDTYWLTTRIIGPSWLSWPYGTWWYDSAGGVAGYDISQGYVNTRAETLMRGLLYWNFTPEGCTIPGHPIPAFWSGSDGGAGSLVTYQARLETAWTMCQNVIKANSGGALTGDTDLSVSVLNPYDSDSVINGNNYRLFFSVDRIDDMTSTAIFGTDFGTIKNFTYTERRPEANSVMCGGPDVDPTTHKSSSEQGFRYYAHRADPGSAARYGLVEEFLDASITPPATDTAYNLTDLTNQIISKAVAELKLKAYNATVEIQLSPDEMVSCGNQYETNGDFWLGCKVTARLNQQTITDVIREIKFDFTQDQGEIVTPTVCDAYKFYYTKPMPFAHDTRWSLNNIIRNWR